MTYCTLDDIFGGIDEEDVIAYTDDFESGIVNIDNVNKAITGADALINSYIAKRYSVPVDPVTDMIKDLAVDIAIYKICSRRSAAPEERRDKYEDAVRYLKEIASGKAILPEAAAAPSDSSDHTVSISSNSRVFSRDSMKGF
ncbi:MAG: DUF1320 domain-containing protein [Desulfobacula sp.]|nr:DUF1320 domain-containing protein [Desulfobacula sp.]